MLLHESGSLHGKLTTAVGRAPVQPQGRVKTEVVVHPGTKQERQAVAVDVMVGQLAGCAHAFVTVLVAVTVATCVTRTVAVETWRTVDVLTTVVGLTTVLTTVVTSVLTVVLTTVLTTVVAGCVMVSLWM
ncbi:hypothetical protein B0T25DRAFT_563785 [Lasiosphaeria hispida]|uniref:Uncharacterized protein n=1 Tax=Lasiosphaeria hispida TaxID=260671 RepID=A0AAJ0HP25_9PEZI|nr:hypothetical protein B0T25DRAFT_563785 [Lasiosphaeria hispida]